MSRSGSHYRAASGKKQTPLYKEIAGDHQKAFEGKVFAAATENLMGPGPVDWRRTGQVELE